MAATSSPTVSASLSPKTAGFKPSASILSTAMSLVRSVPTRDTSNSRSSESTTTALSQPSMTWALVRTRPSSLRMMPVPQ